MSFCFAGAVLAGMLLAEMFFLAGSTLRTGKNLLLNYITLLLASVESIKTGNVLFIPLNVLFEGSCKIISFWKPEL